MEDLLDRIAYLIACALIFLFERIPFAIGLRVGDCFGRWVFYVSKKRRVAYINLKAALGEQLTPAERWKAVRDHFGFMGQNGVEVMSFKRMERKHHDLNVKVHGLERYEELLRSGRGGVLLTAHFGNWELLQVWSGLRGTPIHVLTREQRYPRINGLINELRESHGSVSIRRGAGVRGLALTGAGRPVDAGRGRTCVCRWSRRVAIVGDCRMSVRITVSNATARVRCVVLWRGRARDDPRCARLEP